MATDAQPERGESRVWQPRGCSTSKLDSDLHVTPDCSPYLGAGFSIALQKFYGDLSRQRDVIEAVVRHHLKLDDRDSCIVATERQWIRGAFNVCVPIELAEVQYPGTVDEKMGCEVGAYVWMQEQCPDIRIPHLYGFGFSDGRCFTHEKQRPFYVRIARILQRSLRRYLRYTTVLSRYMLSNTWDTERENPVKRHTLLQGLALLFVSLARIPQPRIGSFQFNDDCTISLSNRPLSCSLMLWENKRDCTYPCAEPYVSDLITCQDNMFLSDPNAAFDDEDCRGHMAARSLVRLLSHRFINREHRYGLFPLQLTDVNRSNIYVDKDWNITCLIDLEWICALPMESLLVPYWLSGHAINKISEPEFDKIQQEFIHAVEEEERNRIPVGGGFLARIMEENRYSGASWLWTAVYSSAMYSLVWKHIYPRFPIDRVKAEEILSGCWREDSTQVIQDKADGLKEYKQLVASLFTSHPVSPSPASASPSP
ncbi:hypothetical protein B0H66DRAFT_575943 [Apodospora peruviana]|uniref:Aminoglycoside phosphotransferase domain-containing protein n=1 Tax=Apodospora peruviana TaxID=516989 RepID=A0AAE0HZJ4_9PEZI|nr:hypothetical protein B0H66DRAFT_575943 [Apodospora peruviana]